MSRPIILIAGPTAGGKTELSIALAHALPGGGECIAADSMQVYRDMDIGTAKPTAAQQRETPHHLLDLVEPDHDGFNVDAWRDAAEQTIAAIRVRGRWPIVCGGTNLYVQALLEGLMDGPEPDPDLRGRLDALDEDALRAWLVRVDPVAAERIHRRDRKRSVRAIEVFERSGRRLSDLQAQWSPGTVRGRSDLLLVGLEWSPPLINRRINERVRVMVREGLIDEVRGLWEADRLGRQAREALGYRQVVDHLEGRATAEEAIEQIKIRTRRFGRHQRTWLRRFRGLERALWLQADDASTQDLVNAALRWIMKNVGDGPDGGVIGVADDDGERTGP